MSCCRIVAPSVISDQKSRQDGWTKRWTYSIVVACRGQQAQQGLFDLLHRILIERASRFCPSAPPNKSMELHCRRRWSRSLALTVKEYNFCPAHPDSNSQCYTLSLASTERTPFPIPHHLLNPPIFRYPHWVKAALLSLAGAGM